MNDLWKFYFWLFVTIALWVIIFIFVYLSFLRLFKELDFFTGYIDAIHAVIFGMILSKVYDEWNK